MCIKDIRVIVFDIGGTLMEYRGMPYVWADFYPACFKHVRDSLDISLNDKDIDTAVDVLRSFNPSINYREIDYSPEYIFEAATKQWQTDVPLKSIIYTFFEAMHLDPFIYPDTINGLADLRKNYKIATLTDVATGMPDDLHKSYFKELLPYFDLYVSSQSCGFRKPNTKGLSDIASYFDITPKEMIMIGDEKKDILVAKDFGCLSVFIDRNGSNKDYGQDKTVTCLPELKHYLEEGL